MSGLWDLKHRPDQPISLFYEELLCYVAEILPNFEGEILELIIFSFFVTKLREPYRGMVWLASPRSLASALTTALAIERDLACLVMSQDD